MLAPAADRAMGMFTADAVRLGIRIFQMHRIGRSDREHVDVLLKAMRAPKGSRVLDVGCGVGEVSRLMELRRPDATFVLLNNCASQLELCPRGFPRVIADMAETDLSDGEFNVVMVNFTLGFGDLNACFAEWARLCSPRGSIFIADVIGPNATLLERVGYTAPTERSIACAAAAVGFKVASFESHHGDGSDFAMLAGDDERLAIVPHLTRTGHWRLVRA